MVDFWSNHLHVNADLDLAWVLPRATTTRSSARTRWAGSRTCCVEASLHPAMLLYLDNWRSVKQRRQREPGPRAPRAAHRRPRVGLHRGDGQGLRQDPVGYTVDAFKTWDGFYDPAKHTTGAGPGAGVHRRQRVRRRPGADPDYLRYLAHHPATARTIARKLARHYVVRQPVHRAGRRPGQGVPRLRHRHQGHAARAGRPPRLPGLARPVLPQPDRGLRRHLPRARVTAQRPDRTCTSFARSMVWMPRLDAALPVAAARRLAVRRRGLGLGDADAAARSGCTGTSPPAGGRPPTSTLPPARVLAAAAQIRLDQYVDHLSRMLLGRPSTTRVARLPSSPPPATPPSTIDHQDHPISRWLFVRLVGGPARLPRPHAPLKGTTMTTRPSSRLLPRVRDDRTRLSRRRFLPGWPRPAGAAVAATMFGDAFRQTAFAATTGRQRAGGDQPARRHRRPRHGRPARRPGLLHGPARRIAVPARVAAGPATTMFGLHPQMAAAGVGCATAASSRPCTPSACRPEPLALLGDGGDRGRRPRLHGSARLGEPDDRARQQHRPHRGDPPALRSSRRRCSRAPRRRSRPAGSATSPSSAPTSDDEWASRRRTSLDLMWSGGDRRRRSTTPTARRAAPSTRWRRSRRSTYTPSVTYPRTWPATDLSDALKDTAQLIKAERRHRGGLHRLRVLGHAQRLRHVGWGEHAGHDRRLRRGARRVPARPRPDPAQPGHRGDDQRVRPPHQGERQPRPRPRLGQHDARRRRRGEGRRVLRPLARSRRRQADRRRPRGHHRLPQRPRRDRRPRASRAARCPRSSPACRTPRSA